MCDELLGSKDVHRRHLSLMIIATRMMALRLLFGLSFDEKIRLFRNSSKKGIKQVM
jgi:hypothetical protein